MSPTIPIESGFEATQAVGLDRELEALLTSAGVATISDIGWIRVTGEDRVRWLNGMVTNSVQDLAPGAGCYSFFLNAQGRIQGDGTIFARDKDLLIETGLAQAPGLISMLDRFIIMDDVELSDQSAGRHGLLVAGPRAPDLLRELGLLSAVEGTAPDFESFAWRSQDVDVIRAWSPRVPRFEIWFGPDEVAGGAIGALRSDVMDRGAAACTSATVDLLRIAEGTPKFGVDIRDRDLPQETGAVRALHFAKGCYLGQEIVERIRSRGNLHRTFQGFRLEGESAAAGAPLAVDGKPVGELTSVAQLPMIDGSRAQVGLGYVRREALTPGKHIEFEGGAARPISLPFSRTNIF